MLKKLLLVVWWFSIAAIATAAQTGGNIGNLGDLGETSIYLSLTRQPHPENPAVVVNEITTEELKKSGVRTIGEALETAAGVDVRNSTKGQNLLNLRGFQQNEVKVLIDGVPAYESYFGLVDLSAVPTASIEKIVITKGASSLLYGPNTMGGVVNIITKKGTEKPAGLISTSFGELSAQSYIFNYGAKNGKINYNVGYSREWADGWELSRDFDKNNPITGISSDYREDGGKRENSDYARQSFVGNIGYAPDDTLKTNFSLIWLNQAKGCPIQNLMGSVQSCRFTEWNQWQTSIAGEKTLSPTVSLKGRIFYVNHTDELSVDTTTTLSFGGRPWFDKSVYNDFSVGGEIDSYLNLVSGNLTKVGLTYQKDQHKDTAFNIWNWSKDKKTYTITPGWGPENEYEADTYSIGVENTLMSIDKLTVNLGCGYNVFVPLKSADQPHPDVATIFTPQAGADYDIAPNTTLYGSVGKKIRFPRMKELYSKIAGGNPDLKPEQAIAAEIGVRQKINDIKIYVSAFDNCVSELIDTKKDASGNKYYVNINSARLSGAEIGVTAPVTGRMNIGGNYTYLYAWDETDNREIAQRPRHKLNLNTDYRFPCGLSVFLTGIYTGEQKIYDNSGTRTAPDYTVVNLKLTQKIAPVKSLSSELFVTVNNVLDKNYEEGDGPMPGRSFFAGLNITF